MKQPKVERRSLCPLAGFAECRGEQCMIWDDDWKLCSLNYGSLYSSARAAACDAAVEVAREYVGERERGALSAFGHFPTAVGKLENSLSQSKADNSLENGAFWGTEADGA